VVVVEPVASECGCRLVQVALVYVTLELVEVAVLVVGAADSAGPVVVSTGEFAVVVLEAVEVAVAVLVDCGC